MVSAIFVLAVPLAGAAPTKPSTAPKPSATPKPSAASIARREFEAATKAFDQGQYAEAVNHYKSAYKAIPDPLFIYNIAQALRLGGEIEDAILHYKVFLRDQPDAPNRAEVEKRIATLEQQLRTKTPTKPEPKPAIAAPAPPPAAPAPAPIAPPADLFAPPPAAVTAPAVVATSRPPHRGMAKIAGGASVLAVGALALVGGVVAGVLAHNSGSALERTAAQGGTFDPNVESRGHSANIASYALYGIGAAAVITGAVVLGLGVKERRGGSRVSARADGIVVSF